MQEPKYAGKYGVEQQLRLLSKWLAETGFAEAAMLVSAAAISVYDATHKRPVTALRNRGGATRAPIRAAVPGPGPIAPEPVTPEPLAATAATEPVEPETLAAIEPVRRRASGA